MLRMDNTDIEMATPPARNVRSTDNSLHQMPYSLDNQGLPGTGQNSPTTLENNSLLKTHILELQNENSDLKARIRGYHTLGSLYSEEKKKRIDLEEIMKKLQMSMMRQQPSETEVFGLPPSIRDGEERIHHSAINEGAVSSGHHSKSLKHKKQKVTPLQITDRQYQESASNSGPSTSLCLGDEMQNTDIGDKDVVAEWINTSEKQPFHFERTVSTPNLVSQASGSTGDSSFVHIDMSAAGSETGSQMCKLRDVSELFVRNVGDNTPPEAVVELIKVCQSVGCMEKQLQKQMEAVKGLTEQNEAKDAKIQENEQEIHKLRQKIQKLDMKLHGVERGMTTQQEQEESQSHTKQYESTTEERLQAKINKLQSFIKSLAEKNHILVERLRNQQDMFDREKKDLLDQLAEAQEQLKVKHQNSPYTQEVKKMKEELLHERQQRKLYQRQLSDIRAETHSVTSPIRLEPQSTATSLDSISKCNPADLREIIRVLRQQVLIYKEDFDGERTDREKCQTEKNDLEKHLKTANERYALAVRQQRQRELECVKLREQYEKLRDELKKKLNENKRLKDHIKTIYQTRSSSASQTSNGVMYPVERLWPCFVCTYENPQERSICELCGTPRRDLFVSQGVLTSIPNMHVHGTRYGREECDETYPQYTETNVYTDVDLDDRNTVAPTGNDRTH